MIHQHPKDDDSKIMAMLEFSIKKSTNYFADGHLV